jgi:hypothetical protein
LPLTLLVTVLQDGLPASVSGTTITGYMTSECRPGSGPPRQADLQAWGQGRPLLPDQGYPVGSNDIFSPPAGGVAGPGRETTSNMSVDVAQGRDQRDSREISPSRYGPKESQSTVQERERELPATWQERLAGRLAQDSRGHMR